MNTAAVCDGLLALVALALAWQWGGRYPALRLAGLILAAAATLGSLRFSGLLPMPALHQFLSALGAAVALPLLACVVIWPQGLLARQPRYAWIGAVVAAGICVVLVVVLELRAWTVACSLASALLILGVAVARRQYLAAGAGICLLLAFAAFIGGLQALGLQAGDFLHLGMASALLLYQAWLKQS